MILLALKFCNLSKLNMCFILFGMKSCINVFDIIAGKLSYFCRPKPNMSSGQHTPAVGRTTSVWTFTWGEKQSQDVNYKCVIFFIIISPRVLGFGHHVTLEWVNNVWGARLKIASDWVLLLWLVPPKPPHPLMGGGGRQRGTIFVTTITLSS